MAANEIAPAPPRRKKPPRRWVPWVVAAALLVALAAWCYVGIDGWIARQRQLAEANARFDDANRAAVELGQKMHDAQVRAQDEIRVLNDQITGLVQDWNQEASLRKKVFDQGAARLIMHSPRAVQAGAKNAIQIEMKRNPNAPADWMPPTLNAHVVDQSSNQILYAKVLEAKNGQTTFNFELPRDLPIKPGMNLALEVIAKEADGAPTKIREHLPLTAPEYVTHLVTDRPLCRPGETVRFRSLTLDRFTLQPAREDLRLRFRITDPKNGEVPGSRIEGSALLRTTPTEPPLKGPDGQPLRGIGAGEFRIPDNLPAGQYTLHVAEANDRFPAEKSSFIVQRWHAPRFTKEITFDRGSYGPGDPVEITAVGVPMEEPGQKRSTQAAMTLTVDGKRIWAEHRHMSADGRIRYPAITLPGAQEMTKGQGIVAVTFDDGVGRETIVRPIPIALSKLNVEFYPEGGDLVGGLANRIYFQASTAAGKPVDLQGRVVDQSGATVTRIQTLTDSQEPGVKQGMGVFTFTPRIDKTYELKIDSPTGMHGKDGKRQYLLPKANVGGVALTIPQGVVEKTINVEVTSADKDRQLLIGAYCRGKLMDQVNVDAKAGQPTAATLRPSLHVGGVYRITVFDKQAAQLVPVAERLIYRNTVERLNLSVTADKGLYHPGDRVRLALEANNEKNERAPAVLMVAVVDRRDQKPASDKTARAMTTHFLLASEVRQPAELEYADFFLGDHPKARQALDLLLGVQGWRRFAEQDPDRFKKQEAAAGRILQAAGPGGLQTSQPDKEVLAKVDARFASQFVELQKMLATKESIAAGDPDFQIRIQKKQLAMESAQQRIGRAVSDLEEYERYLLRIGMATLVIGALLLGFFMLYLGMRRLSRGRSAAGYFFFGAFILLFVFMGSLVGAVFMIAGHGFGHFEDRWAGVPQAKPAVIAPAGPVVIQVDDALLDHDLDATELRSEEVEDPAAGMSRVEQNGTAVAPNAPKFATYPAAAPMAAPAQNAAPLGGPPGAMAGNEIVPKVPANDAERQMRQQGDFKGLLRRRLNRVVDVASSAEPFVVREYAHNWRPNRVGFRDDNTLFWHPALVLPNGKEEIAFDLSDGSTRCQVLAFGHTLDGRLGATTHEIVSRLPVSIEPKVPIEVTSSDIITIPIAVANDRREPVAVTLAIHHKNLLRMAPGPLRPNADNRRFSLDGNKRTRELFSVEPAVKERLATVRVSGDFGHLGRDAVERTFKIVPEGFPIVGAHSGLLEKSASHELTLPASWIAGALKCQLQVFPSTSAKLQNGPAEVGNLTLFVGDREAPVAVKTFPSTIQEPITLAVPAQEYLHPGPNRIRILISGRNELPYTLSWSYQTPKSDNPVDCSVHLAARLQKSEVKEGDTVRLSATVENKSGKGQGMTVAIIGLPAGVSIPDDFAQLKGMTARRDNGAKAGLISAWELRGRELVVYWRDLAPDAKIEINLDVICRLLGIYRGVPSRAYLYYNSDSKFWTDPLAITIHPAGQ